MNEIKYFFMNKLHVTKVSWTCYIYEWESEPVRSEKDVRGGKDYGQFHTEKQWRVSHAPHLHDLSRVNRIHDDIFSILILVFFRSYTRVLYDPTK